MKKRIFKSEFDDTTRLVGTTIALFIAWIVGCFLLKAFAVGRASRPIPDLPQNPVVAESPSPSPSALPSANPSPSASISGGPVADWTMVCADCVASESRRVEAAQVIVRSTLVSKCFRDQMNAIGLIWTNGKTADQVVDDLISKKIVAPVHYYRQSGNVVGYRNPPQPDIYFNRRFHDFYTAADTASNAAHEMSHVAGYDHPFNPTPTRGQTVPYAINRAFNTCNQALKEAPKGFLNSN